MRAFRAAALASVLLVACHASALPDRSGEVAGAPLDTTDHRLGEGVQSEFCNKRPARRIDPELVNRQWERRIARLAAGRSLSVAVARKGRLAFSYRGRADRIPASNQKLFLSMALLHRFGPDFRIPTRALGERIRGETLEGALWVTGRGDPTLTKDQPGYWGDVRATSLALLARRIARAGITHIDGRVMAARDYFAHDIHAPGWQSYVPHRYVRLPTALAMNGNNGAGAPERAVAAALTQELRALGVSVEGRPGAGAPPNGLRRVAAVRSRPLADIVGHMNLTSDNFFAEMLGKLLGANRYGAPGTIAKGAHAVRTWASHRGVVISAYDSSGLSYDNRASAVDIVRLLGAAEPAPWINDFRRGLPAAGEGTLRGRLHGLRVRAKTGTLFNGASALSGWVHSKVDGRWIAFSILDTRAGKAIEDRIVRIISEARIARMRGKRVCRG